MAPKRDIGARKSRRRRSPSPAALLYFFKIIFSDTLDERKMRIPAKFGKKFGNELSDVATLILPNGRTWQVELTRFHNQIWFDAGWHEFVEHNSIGCRFLLVFTYRGSSNFDVLIFDTTACEIQYPSDSRTSEGPNYGKTRRINDEDETEDMELVEVSGRKIPSPRSFSCKSRAFDDSASKGESSKRHTEEDHSPILNKLQTNDASMEIPHGTDVGNCLRSKRSKMESPDEAGDYNASELRRVNLDKHELLNPYGSPVSEIRDGKAAETIPGKLLIESILIVLLSCYAVMEVKVTIESLQCEDITDVANEMFTSGLTRASQESERAIHAARMFKPKNPSFMTALRPYNFYNHFLHVPGEFAKRYMAKILGYIKLHVPDGRQWPVRVLRKKRGGLTLGRGWNEFFRENDLKIGDVCVFEIMKKNSGLKVSIFPAVQDN
ncbi:hypothetical protein K2173_012825 [Erythroxylum novogranatense]|uniref:TF-B3 domain-containing protein n=1 Tax=Erythroxylum novogranatense TaxID=1862640 RepID=A0AAV8S6C8_9ROSI|nr:hypothetical protein K2173_012825 [Erythroxylum novogranatense]